MITLYKPSLALSGCPLTDSLASSSPRPRGTGTVGGVDSQGLPCRGPAGSQGFQEAASQAGGVWSMRPLSESRGAAHPGPQLGRTGYQQQNAGIHGNLFLRLRPARHFLQSGLASRVASEFQSKDLWGHLRFCADFADVEPQLREGAGWLEGTQRQSLGSRSQGHRAPGQGSAPAMPEAAVGRSWGLGVGSLLLAPPKKGRHCSGCRAAGLGEDWHHPGWGLPAR